MVDKSISINTEKNVEYRMETDPELIYEGLWLAMAWGNRAAKRKQLPPIENVVKDVHSRIIRPVVADRYRYLLEEYRTRDVLVLGGIIHPARWTEIPQIMEEYSTKVEEMVKKIKNKMNGKKEKAITEFIDLISYTHFTFYKAHPFLDGHKRTGRQVVDILAKHLGYKSVLVPYDRKKDYLDSIAKVTQTRDIRYFTIFQAELVAESYRASTNSSDRNCFDSAKAYRSSLIREVNLSEKNKNSESVSRSDIPTNERGYEL